MCVQYRQARIETDRLILRPPRPEDATAIAERINDYDIARMTVRVPYPYALTDAEDFLEAYAASDVATDRVFLIEHRAFGLIGCIGFHAASTAWSPSGCALSPELGYWVARSYWGRGFASEAATALMDWARGEWGVRAAAAGHFTDNPASARVLEKVGFLYTGEVQARFSVARGERAPARMMLWMA